MSPKKKSSPRSNKKSGPKSSARSGRNLEQTVRTDAYEHPEATAIQRPEAGQQTQFRKKQPPRTYRYDSSLSPALDWDGQNSAREQGEAALARMRATLESVTQRIRTIGGSSSDEKEGLEHAAALLHEDIEKLAAISGPFLNWAGKAERLSFEVPTLPLFVHEKLSTEAIIASLKTHRRDERAGVLSLDLFGDERQSLADKLVRAYEHQGRWVNRMILGDSLVVMSSLLHYENLGAQVQMIYMDPPYGISYNSNFQPFVRRRQVSASDDGDMSREPETVQAYRDTWSLGLHSYLTFLRDRFLLARELLSPSGVIFVQISDDHVHHVREALEEVFGANNFLSLITVPKTTGVKSTHLATVADFLVAYARDIERTKYRQLHLAKTDDESAERYDQVELADGSRRTMTKEERDNPRLLPVGARRYQLDNLTSPEFRPDTTVSFEYEGVTYHPGDNNHWKTTVAGLTRLAEQGRLQAARNTLRYVRFLDDFAAKPIANVWSDISGSIQSRSEDKVFTVQTSTSVIARCVLMTTDPGDLVLDPTCGSGTSAWVAEHWGRRWITIDSSRVPLALARQRLLTATFPWFKLVTPDRGPAGGFAYARRKNSRGEDVGGLLPHVTLGTIANDEPEKEEVLVDRPEVDNGVVRVTGPFWVEATIPTPVDFDEDGVDDSTQAIAASHLEFTGRMLEVLRRSSALRVSGDHSVRLHQVRPPAKSVYLSAEALVETTSMGQTPSLVEAREQGEAKRADRLDLTKKPVAFVFGPEHGAIGEKLVFSAGKEANAKHYTHLYVIGFAIQSDARMLVEQADSLLGIPATYVQATPDMMMGDLLKTTRTSQVFSVCGLPDVEVRDRKDGRWEVELHGLDTFDPVTNEVKKLAGKDVPAWFVDLAWNEQVFHVSQAFFPRTGAWDSLKQALKADYAESLWAHLAGTVSAPFDGNRGEKIAVKVIDDRGNELQVVKVLGER